ncbi:MAG: hypothetical protein GY754_26485 [bacterium]|nr:hypothetical protein [bacterium]
MIKIAEIFNVSLDYLVFDKKLGDVKADIKDRELLEQLEEVDKFDEEKKVIIKKFLSLMINEEKIKNMVS